MGYHSQTHPPHPLSLYLLFSIFLLISTKRMIVIQSWGSAIINTRFPSSSSSLLLKDDVSISSSTSTSNTTSIHVSSSRHPLPPSTSTCSRNGFPNCPMKKKKKKKKKGSIRRSSNVRASSYHPFEHLSPSSSSSPKSSSPHDEATLTPSQFARTFLEVNTNATLMLTGFIHDHLHHNIIWPHLPYLTDQHGNFYFQVPNDDDIFQTLTSDNNFVQAIVGFDPMEIVSDLEELLGPSDIDFGIEEDEDEDEDDDADDDNDEDDTDDDDEEDYNDDVVAIVEDNDEGDISDESLGDWAKLETMRSSHPMHFAKKLAQAATDDPVDWMEQPPVGLAIHGVLRPAFIEEHSDIQRHTSAKNLQHADKKQVGRGSDGKLKDLNRINGHSSESEISEDISILEDKMDKTEISRTGVSLYKLEMLKIQLISAHGDSSVVEVEDFGKAQPDSVALSASKIISHLKAGGKKITEALKSLCWRLKGVEVEEAALISVDSLGFDLRVCCGTQIQTLRFAFNSRATSVHDAEKQLDDLLFPRAHQRLPQKKQTHRK